jgi:paired amphipathic helix protein Sin3a
MLKNNFSVATIRLLQFSLLFRSKSLLNEIETLYDEQHEQEEQGLVHPARGPHLTTSQYKDKTMLDDATQLLIHHVKRQTCIHKEDKQRIKQFLRHSLPDMFHHARQAWTNELSRHQTLYVGFSFS